METGIQTMLTTRTGQPIQVCIGPPAAIDSFFVFSLHKAGSTLLNRMMRTACDFLEIPIFEPEVEEFRHGVALGSLGDDVRSLLKRTGYCFGGFRILPPYLADFDLKPFRKIFLIRDPRDILVSHYFSQKVSHAIAPGELGEKMLKMRSSLESKTIDQYAIESANGLKSRIEKYEAKIFDGNLRLFRYEDVIFAKRDWLLDMLEFVGLQLQPDQIDHIVQQVDQRPADEDPNRHIRKVTPGDHVDKLQPETIQHLDTVFQAILERYGYF